MIRHDTISRILTILAVLITLYLSTFTPSTLVLFPAILLISGMVLQLYLEKKIQVADSVFEEQTLTKIGFYTVIALFGISFTGIIVGKLVLPQQLTVYDAMLYGVLMAIAEEQFFRGFILNFMLERFPPLMACILAASLFTVYHFARYGLKTSVIIYIFISGLVLSWVAYKSGRLSPVMLAHSIHNIISAVS